MKEYQVSRQTSDCHGAGHLGIVFAFLLIIFGCALFGFSAESAQVTPVSIPIGLVNPLLSSQIVLVNNPAPKEETTIIIGCGLDGAALIIRVSGHD